VNIKELKKLGLGNNNFITTSAATSDEFLKVCKLGGIYGE